MTDPIRFLTSLGQALSATNLYGAGHPARERAINQVWDHLTELQRDDPNPTFSFLDDEILYRQQALRDYKSWDWARRLAKVGVCTSSWWAAPLPPTPAKCGSSTGPASGSAR